MPRYHSILSPPHSWPLLHIVATSADLCLAAQVVRSGALHKQRDRFTLDVCTAAVPLLEALAASDAQQHGQAVLQLLDAILERWGAYALDVLRWVRERVPSHKSGCTSLGSA